MVGKKLVKEKNKGAALIMVIVTIAFVSIFATIILYLTSVNFFMKSNDMKTKQSFYEGEEALEQVKASLMRISAEAYRTAFDETMAKAAEMDAATLKQTFQKRYFLLIEKRLFALAGDPSTAPSADELTAYFKDNVLSDTFKGSGAVFSIEPNPTTTLVYEKSWATEDKYTFLTIKTIKIEFTDSAGYTTILSTGYRFTAPEIDYGALTGEATVLASGTWKDKVKLIDCVTYEDWRKE